MNDQAQRLRELAAAAVGNMAGNRTDIIDNPVRCRSFAITGGKGGVGKSNIAMFLSTALSGLGKKVLLLDADLGLANIHILLGLNPRRNLAHVIGGECALEEILFSGPAGVDILPGASGLAEMADLPPMRLQSVLQALAKLEQSYAFLVIDVGAGVGRNTVHVAGHADTSILVLTPEPTSLADAYSTYKLLRNRNMGGIQALVNMAGNDDEGREIHEKLEKLTKNFLHSPLPLLGVLPFDADVGRYVRNQKNATLEKPRSTLSVRIRSVARNLAGMPQTAGIGFFARFLTNSRTEE